MAAKKKKTERTEDIKRESFRQELQVKLSAAEVADRAQRAAHLIADHDAQEATFKEQAGANKLTLKRIGSEMRKVSEEVRSGSTYRDVPCERIYNWTVGSVKDVRTDTGETIKERAMSESERQKSLPFDPPETSDDLDDEFGGEEEKPAGGEKKPDDEEDDEEDGGEDKDDGDDEAAE
jgi:hypothetical protein